MAYWVATQLLPRSEQRAQFFLELAGFECANAGRRAQILAPLFPGYCFVRIEMQWRRAQWCPGRHPRRPERRRPSAGA